MRNSHHLSSVDLRDWILFYMPRDEQKAYTFVDEISVLADYMKFKVGRGQM